MFRTYRLDDADQKARIEQALHETYFAAYERSFLETEAGRADVAAHVSDRYNLCIESTLPWLSRFADLGALDVIEVGCGTGSSTAAFARAVRHVSGYDIQASAVEGARARMRAMDLRNVALHCVEPERLFETLRREHPEGTDVFLLYAVLEHQTIQERLETLRLGWELLRPGGLLVVYETPNRLAYLDDHTSLLPFFHCLPPELAAQYSRYSPRAVFRDAMSRILPEEGPISIVRWGQGVSYHEFELALGELAPLLVGTGFEPEILGVFPPALDEELLRFYVQERQQGIPLGLTRRVLNLVFRKGDNAALIAQQPPPPPFQFLPQASAAPPPAVEEAPPPVVEEAPPPVVPEAPPAEPAAEVPLRYQLADQLNEALKHAGFMHRYARRLMNRALTLTGRRSG